MTIQWISLITKTSYAVDWMVVYTLDSERLGAESTD